MCLDTIKSIHGTHSAPTIRAPHLNRRSKVGCPTWNFPISPVCGTSGWYTCRVNKGIRGHGLQTPAGMNDWSEYSIHICLDLRNETRRHWQTSRDVDLRRHCSVILVWSLKARQDFLAEVNWSDLPKLRWHPTLLTPSRTLINKTLPQKQCQCLGWPVAC